MLTYLSYITYMQTYVSGIMYFLLLPVHLVLTCTTSSSDYFQNLSKSDIHYAAVRQFKNHASS